MKITKKQNLLENLTLIEAEDPNNKEDKLSITLPGAQEKQEEIRHRVVKVLRVAKEAREAAEKARAKGNNAMADQLDEEAQQLEDWAETVYDVDRDGAGQGKGEAESEKEAEDETADSAVKRAQEAAENAAESAKNAQAAADKAQANADEAAKNGTKEEAEQAAKAAEKAQEAADKAQEAADMAQEAANEAEEAAENDDADGARKAANDAEAAAKQAKEAADKAEEAASNNSSAEQNDADSADNADNDSDDSSEDANSSNNSNSSNSSSSSSNQSQSQSQSQSNSDLENPFNLNPKNAQMSANMPNQQNQSKQDEFDAMMQILGMLRGGESDGAKAALNDILKARAEAAEEANKNESLTEKLNIHKAIDEVSDDEFDDIVNQALDNINAIAPVSYADDRAVRVGEIQKDINSTQTQRDLNREDQANRLGGKEQIRKNRAEKREIEKYKLENLPNTQQFKLDLYDAIYDQVDKVKKQHKSWGAINKKHQGSDIIVPGHVIQGEWEEVKPTIQVYLDSSGSFNDRDIQKERALMGVLAEFEERDEIETQIYYFANHVHDDYASARAEGGTSAWPEIMENIRKTNPANVLVVTDNDMNGQGFSNGYYKVDGCVWYIWKKYRAQSLPEHLYGSTGLKEYSIEW